MLHNALIDYLQKDMVQHIDMLQALLHDAGTIPVAYSHDGILLHQPHAGMYTLSATSDEAALSLMAHTRDEKLFLLHQPFGLSSILKQYTLSVMMECYQAAYLSDARLPLPNNAVTIHQLNEDYIDMVKEHYTLDLGDAYLHDRLKAGVMYGAFAGKQLAGFIGQHKEGSLGLLEVFPSFRNQAIGYTLQAFYTNLLLTQGRVPYGQVITSNKASLALQRKLGYTISKEPVFWLEKQQ